MPKLPEPTCSLTPRSIEAELVLGAARDGEVALARVERALEDAQRRDELGNDEVRSA